MEVKPIDQENEINGFLKSIFQASTTAKEKDQSSVYKICLANKIFDLHIPNPATAAILLPPLEHLKIENQQNADFHIVVWDSKSANIEIPDFPWKVDRTPDIQDQKPHDGQTIFYQNEDIALAFQSVRQHLSIADLRANQAVFWTPSIENYYPLDGRPLRTIFQWLLEKSKHQIVHAGGVGFKDGGVIITGKSGAGKSTSTVACLNSSLALAGDENVILSIENDPQVYSLYNSTNLDPKSFSLLPFLKSRDVSIQENRIDKHLIYLQKFFPGKFIAKFPLKAIVVSEVSGIGDPILEPVSATAALTALAPTSIFQIPGNKKTSFFRMSQIVKQIPCYKLTIGKSMDDIPPLLIELIQNYQ